MARYKPCTDDFIKKSIKIHNSRYDYSKTFYTDSLHKVIIICHIHGDFAQMPYSHLSGRGCPRCAATSSTEDFIRKAVEVHGTRYDYSITNFINVYTKVKIICKKHGIFEQTTSNHMNGAGCRKCRSRISRMSDEWLDSLGVPNDNEHREVILPVKIGRRRYIVDGYNPKTNTVYEFWGDFWHGNLTKYSGDHRNNVVKKTMAQLNEQTQLKSEKIRAAGYKLVDIWESDWITQNKEN